MALGGKVKARGSRGWPNQQFGVSIWEFSCHFRLEVGFCLRRVRMSLTERVLTHSALADLAAVAAAGSPTGVPAKVKVRESHS